MNAVAVAILGTMALPRILHLEIGLLRRASGIGGLALVLTGTVVYLLTGADLEAYPGRPRSL